MRARRTIGVLMTACLMVVLTACGNDREASAPTEEPDVESTSTLMIVAPTQTAKVATIGATPVGVATPVIGATSVMDTTSLTGTLVLVGQEHVDFYVAADGCYGLGTWRGLQPGAQLVVRNASGTVVDISELVASDDDGCAWTFETQAPADTFVSVSVPMVLEHWITAEDVISGSVVIELP